MSAFIKGVLVFGLFWLLSTFVFTNMSWFHDLVDTTEKRLLFSTVSGFMTVMSRVQKDAHWGAGLYITLVAVGIIYGFVLLFSPDFAWSRLGTPLFYLVVLLPMGLAGQLRGRQRAPAFSNIPPIG